MGPLFGLLHTSGLLERSRRETGEGGCGEEEGKGRGEGKEKGGEGGV